MTPSNEGLRPAARPTTSAARSFGAHAATNGIGGAFIALFFQHTDLSFSELIAIRTAISSALGGGIAWWGGVARDLVHEDDKLPLGHADRLGRRARLFLRISGGMLG